MRREAEPGTQLDALKQEVARGEPAIVLNVFGNDRQRVPVDVIRTWWVGERFPDGWRPTRKVTFFSMIKTAFAIRMAMERIRSLPTQDVAQKTATADNVEEAQEVVISTPSSPGDNVPITPIDIVAVQARLKAHEEAEPDSPVIVTPIP